MKKPAKLALVLALLAAGGLLAFAGAAPQAMRSVADVARDPSAFESKTVQVKATVSEGSLERGNGTLRFVVEDADARLPVEWASERPAPEHEAGGTIEGRSVVLHGTTARRADGAWVFRAIDMQVGCASKYEPAAPTPDAPA